MCIVITNDGTEILVPEPVYLDSNNIRRTVKFLIAENKAYQEERKHKREQRRQANKKFFRK